MDERDEVFPSQAGPKWRKTKIVATCVATYIVTGLGYGLLLSMGLVQPFARLMPVRPTYYFIGWAALSWLALRTLGFLPKAARRVNPENSVRRPPVGGVKRIISGVVGVLFLVVLFAGMSAQDASMKLVLVGCILGGFGTPAGLAWRHRLEGDEVPLLKLVRSAVVGTVAGSAIGGAVVTPGALLASAAWGAGVGLSTSLAVGPAVGFLGYAVRSRSDLPLSEDAEAQVVEDPTADSPVDPAPSSQSAVFEDLKRLGELRDSEVLTDEEFKAKKRELLDRI